MDVRDQADTDALLPLSLNENLFRELVNSAPDAMVIVDRDGRIRLTNRQVTAIFGYAEGELIGQPVEVLLPERFHAAHLHHRAVYAGEPHTRSMGAELDLRGRRKDGSEFPVEVSLSPITTPEGSLVAGAIRDITDRARVLATLRIQNELINLASDAIVVRAPSGEIAQWNHGAELLYGWSHDEAIGRRIHSLLSTRLASGAPVASITIALERDGVWEGELFHTRRDGTEVLVESRQVLIRNEFGGHQAVLAVNRDNTERRRVEEALKRAREESDRANLAKSEFLSRMSHELRTPLNAILGFAQVLERTPLTTQQERGVRRILGGGRHLLSLINEVLDIARIESGRLPLSPEPVPLRDVVRESLDLAQPLANDNSVVLLLDTSLEQSEVYVLADRQRLKQVVLNLLANAVKYNRRGGSVTISAGPVGEDRYRLSVRDTGIGIPPDKQDRVFSPFDRLGAENSTVEGTGLGLALSLRLVEAQGGSLAFESTEGVGSTFWIELKRVDGPNREGVHAHSAQLQQAAPETTRRVVYIEDNLPNLELIQEILGFWPHVELIPAMQGSLGIELAFQHHPDLILLDLHLPDIPGIEVLRQLRADDRTREVPVVVVSADATPGQLQRLLNEGVRDYLTKPIELDRFIEVVGGILSPKEDGA